MGVTCVNTMNECQEVFALFYAVLFGGMLASLRKFFPFSWGLGVEEDRRYREKLIYRLIISFLVLNVMPIAIFACGYELLEDGNIDSVYDVICIGIAALSVFTPYRFFHVLLCLPKKIFNIHIALYTKKEMVDMIEDRKMRIVFSGYASGVFFYAACFFLLGFSLDERKSLWIFNNQRSLLHISWICFGISFFFLTLSMYRPKRKNFWLRLTDRIRVCRSKQH